jgi:hypothetical protein
MIKNFLIFALLASYSTFALAAEDTELKNVLGKPEAEKFQGKRAVSITQIFSQIFAVGIPEGFVSTTEKNTQGYYSQNYVLQGETDEKWTQKITVAGSKGLSLNPAASPEKLLLLTADGMSSICPKTFSSGSLGAGKIDGHDTYGLMMACGEVPTSQGYVSDKEMAFVIKGNEDYYTIIWAERGVASKEVVAFDKSTWEQRMVKLKPIKLCAVVPGEPKPYLSCISQINK